MTVPGSVAARVAGVLASLDVSEPRRVLVVDDEESIRISLSKFLRSRGYEVQAAESGARAIELLRASRFDALICDVRMPGMAGTDVVPRAVELSPDLAILMLTAVSDAPTVTDVLAHGAMDYLMKPLDLADLARAVAQAVRRRDLEIRQRHVERLVADEVARVTDLVREEVRTAKEGAVGVARRVVEALENRGEFMRGHSKRVAGVAAAIGQILRLGESEVALLRVAGELHDIGNVGVPEGLLNKPGSLTADERAHVRDHVRIGLGVLLPLESLATVLPFIQDHHERWDGSGYPRGLTAGGISIGGRILAAADAFVALTAPRAYRRAATPEVALHALSMDLGRHFDPVVFDALRQAATA